MKKRIIILVLGCFLAKNSPAMLEEISLSDADTKNSKKNLINLAEKKQHPTSNYDKAILCCSTLLDCLFGHAPKPKLAFTQQCEKHVIPNE